MGHNRRYPLRPQTDPGCTARLHGTMTAHKRHHCTCDEAAAAMAEYRERARVAVAERRAAGEAAYSVGDGSVTAPDFPSTTPPDVEEASRLERLVRARTDLPCRSEDPNLFYPAGPNDHARTAAAKAVCRRCPVEDDCLSAALMRGDDWAVLGGTSGPERRRMRVQMAGAA